VADSGRSSGDIAGWTLKAGKNKTALVGEIETESLMVETEVSLLWQNDAGLGVPLFTFVPKGRHLDMQKIALQSNIALNGVYEYLFVKGALQNVINDLILGWDNVECAAKISVI
jgi:hypothetical protein